MPNRKKGRQNKKITLEVTVDRSGFVQNVRRVEHVSQKPFHDPYVICSLCDRKVHRSDLMDHRRNAHDVVHHKYRRSETKPLPTRSNSRPGDYLIHCPLCLRQIKKRNLRKHITSVHENATILKRPQRTLLTGVKGIHNSEQSLAECPKCEISVKKKNLKKHLRKVHKAEALIENNPKETQTLTGKQNKKGQMACTECGVELPNKRMKGHLWRFHRISQGKENKAATKAAEKVHYKSTPASNQPMITCPKCHVSVRKDRLARHLKKAHRKHKSRIQRTIRREQKTRPSSKSGKERRSKTRTRAKISRNLSFNDQQKLEALKQSLDGPFDGSKH
jgi:hypothetical protein